MSRLDALKQLLVAESELNRAQLIASLADMSTGVQVFTERASEVHSLISSSATLLAGLMDLATDDSAQPPAKSSWMRRLVSGGSLAMSLWRAFQTRR